jgi:hypothetical protein
MGHYGLAFQFATGHLLLCAGGKPRLTAETFESKVIDWSAQHFEGPSFTQFHYACPSDMAKVHFVTPCLTEHAEAWAICAHLLHTSWLDAFSIGNSEQEVSSPIMRAFFR